MTPTQARAFHAVGRAGSFTGAARWLNVSQPTVTTQVRELEKTYGVELFLRTPAGVTMTETGSALFRLVDEWQKLQRECQEYLKGVTALQNGRLVIGTYGPFDAMDLTALMRQRHPGLSISMVFANSHQLKARLRSHEIDVAVMTGVRYDDGMSCLQYRHRTLVALVPRDHRWFGRGHLTLDEMAGEPLVCRERGSAVRDYLEIAAEARGVALGWTAEIGSRGGGVGAVESNIGIGVVFDEGHVPTDRIAIVPIANLHCHATVDVVCLTERAGSRIIRSFVELAAETAPGANPPLAKTA